MLVGVDPGRGSEPWSSVDHGHGPAVVVDEVVVSVAEQGEVVELGGAAVGPVLHVVGVAAAWSSGAAGEAAAAVAEVQGAAHGFGDGVGEPADVERLAA